MVDHTPPVNHVDVARHGGEEAPASSVPKPELGSSFELDSGVREALPIAGTTVIFARNYGMSLWGQTAKITAQLPNGERKNYFLKTITLGENGRVMMEGEFESLKAIHHVSSDIAPEVYSWGKFKDTPPDVATYFLLAQFRDVGKQPPDPIKFTTRLAEMHKNSVSPTGKFGFHITTCHAKLPQITDCWEDSWEVLYRKQLEHMIKMDEEKHGEWPEFQVVCKLTLDKVIPRLLGPLQSEGRTLKPCLLHGDLWDENTATDMDTGEPFIFDAGSFYGHNEYEIGNWRSARHRLSDKRYVRNYIRNFSASAPEDEWDDRNLLYSLRYDLGTAILIPRCNQRQVVKENMTLLCQKFCPADLAAGQGRAAPGLCDGVDDAEDEEEEEDESD
ncbi:Fructosamine kinase-domain-containing protein [Xylariomycetidae sp. FL2044]|nr:Fructosamine kinase-domain-containing protein [Xylariomycetidae sp. FL2044]